MKLEIQDYSENPVYNLLTNDTLKTHMQANWSTYDLGDGLYEERIPLRAYGTKATTVISVDSLSNIGEASRQFISDPLTTTSYWLAQQSDGESNGRRALIHNLTIEPSDQEERNRLMGYNISLYSLVITRGQWESPAVRQFADTDISAGEGVALTGGGSKPGRVSFVQFTNGASMSSNRSRHWMGIRPTYFGYSSFTGEWDWTQGQMGADASVVGSTVEISFTTLQQMDTRVTLRLNNIVGSNFSHLAGEYVLVMPWQLSSGEVAFKIVCDGVESEPIYTDNDGLNDVATIRIPSRVSKELGGLVPQRLAIEFAAQRISGSGTLTIDKVYAVPARHFIYTEGVMTSAGTTAINIRSLAAGEHLQQNTYNGTIIIGNPQVINWQMPIEEGIFVYVGGNDDNTVGGGVDLDISIIDRWETYRA